MDGRTLLEKLNYVGMERSIRKLAIKENLAKTEDVATMSTLEVCILVSKIYDVLSCENDNIILFKRENRKEIESLIERISR